MHRVIVVDADGTWSTMAVQDRRQTPEQQAFQQQLSTELAGRLPDRPFRLMPDGTWRWT